MCQKHTKAHKNIQTKNITLQHMTHFITQTHDTNPNRDVPNDFGVLRNKSLSRKCKQPTFLVNSYKEVAVLVVNNGGGMCKAGFFAGDDALRAAGNDSGVQGWFFFASDDALRAADPSSCG